MVELNFFLLMGVLTQNFNIVVLVEFLEKIKNKIKFTCRSMSKKKSVKSRFCGQNMLLS
jgi:hypothetical protein